MFRILGRSRITLNTHITASESSTGNIRLFEATGIGTCLVTDWKEDLKDLFELESEVVAYRSPDECSEKVRWLLDNPERCREIAAARATKNPARSYVCPTRGGIGWAFLQGAITIIQLRKWNQIRSVGVLPTKQAANRLRWASFCNGLQVEPV